MRSYRVPSNGIDQNFFDYFFTKTCFALDVPLCAARLCFALETQGESQRETSGKNLRARVADCPRSLRVSSAQQDGGAAARSLRFTVIVT